MMRFGLFLAGAAFLSDRLSKWWLLQEFGIESRGRVELTPFFDLIMVWNKGISYGLFQSNSQIARYLLIAFSLAVVAYLIRWLSRAHSYLLAMGIGLIVGGALGNVVDRVIYGAVADFFHFHAYGISWYVFNVADAAIVVGVAIILLDAAVPRRRKAGD